MFLIALSARLGSAQSVLLDDYASDANFQAGKYTFYEVFGRFRIPVVDSVTVSDGTLKIDVIDENGRPLPSTNAYMWNAGEALRRVGDRVSVELTGVSQFRTAGLYIDSDLAGPENGAEIRWNGYNNNLHLTARLDSGHQNITIQPEPYVPIGDWALVEMVMEVRLTSVADSGLTLTVDVASSAFPTVSGEVVIPGELGYFGPVAWYNFSSEPSPYPRSEHDNLTFTPFAPETGDLNGDGVINNLDISAFLLAMTDRARYETAFVGLDADGIGDFSGDGLMDNRDISGFVDALTGPTLLEALLLESVPEPASIFLLGAAGLIPWHRPR
ncbi:MAG: hypothetical protein AAGI37_13610 [Planctomycetota bacterium]